ncbi:MAG: bifunctional DNA primase/polymerase, partial [Gammaproteobacteria bacterium]|nr:bifunctional DNA primase/polymerase [Gammaproteobacteria bacterium]
MSDVPRTRCALRRGRGAARAHVSDDTLLAHALGYARHGWPVFPCKPDKSPYTKHGFKDATRDEATIAEWWSEHPGASIGIPTGCGTNLCVIDIDTKNGAQGAASSKLLRQKFGQHNTRKSTTQNNGRHIYFFAPKDITIKSRANFMPGIDIRGDGGYVIAPGSPGYKWLDASVEIEPLPAALADALTTIDKPKANGRDDNAIPEGKRNATLVSLAGSMRDRGMSQDAIAAALKIENASRCNPPLDDVEVERIAASVNRYPANNAEPKARLVHVSELQTRQPEYTIDGLIEKDTVGVVFGEYGTLKTFLALDLALCVGTGKDFHGHSVQAGIAVYVCGEGHNGIARRVTGWAQHHGQDIVKSDIFLTTSAVPLLDRASAELLRDQITIVSDQRGAPVQLIILDTIARNFGGDENSTRDMTAFLDSVSDNLRAPVGASVILVHHTGHAEKLRGRGAYALSAGVDFEYRAEMPEDDVLQLTCTKMKDAPRPEPLAFRAQPVTWQQNAHTLDSLVLTPLFGYEAPGTEGPLGKNQDRLMEALRELYQHQRKNLTKGGGDP